MKSLILKILIFIFLLMFLYSGWQLYRIYYNYKSAKDQYQDLTQYVCIPADSISDSVTQTAKDQKTAGRQEPEAQSQAVEKQYTTSTDFQGNLPPQVDFPALSDINSDVAAWLLIEGTQINYPVVQGEDNDFYLTHQFDRRYNQAGCLFLDIENDASFQEYNQIVYGHHMKNKSMFHDLTNYKDQAFFDAHPTGWLITPSAAYQLHFFSGYVSDASGEAWDTDFTEEEYLIWLSSRQDHSLFSSSIQPTKDSRVLTLSTCSYEFQDARFVLHAVLQAYDY